MSPTRPARDEFERFVAAAEPRLRRALVATYGTDLGRETTGDALAWAWEHWDRIAGMANPVGYLYRVGQTRARRRFHRRSPLVPPVAARSELPWFEPSLSTALRDLTDQQRVAVVLCHGYQWTHREVAELLDISPSTVQNHVERALRKLRNALEVFDDARCDP